MWALNFLCLALIHCHLCTSLSFIETLRAHFTVLLSIPSLSLFWVILRLLGYLLIRSSSLVTSLSCLCSTGSRDCSRDYTPASLHSLPTSAVLPDFSDMTPFSPISVHSWLFPPPAQSQIPLTITCWYQPVTLLLHCQFLLLCLGKFSFKCLLSLPFKLYKIAFSYLNFIKYIFQPLLNSQCFSVILFFPF